MSLRAFTTILILAAVVTSSRVLAREILLTDLIHSLQAHGINIVYSSALVNSDDAVDVEGVNLEELQRALHGLGLKLKLVGDVWVVMRGDDEPMTEAVTSAASERVLETIIVTGSLHRLPHTSRASSVASFVPEEMSLAPTLGSDAMRATLRLPGVSSLGVSAKPRIRGGLQDELLVLQDGIELLEPFHLADYHSPYSSIDYHTIESMDVYTGGFPSRYGYRISGVMDIRNQWQEEDYNTDIGVSSFSNFIHTRGSHDGSTPASWLLSVRHGDLSGLTGYIDTRSGDPIYTDVSARINVELSEELEVTTGAVWATDDIEFSDAEEQSSSRIDTWYAWGSADWRVNSKLASRFTLSWLEFSREKRQNSFEFDEEDPGKGGFLDHRQEIGRLALRNDWSALVGDATGEFGWQLEYNRGDYRHEALIDRGELASILGTGEVIASRINRRPDGWSGGGYAQLDWQISPRLTVLPSLRWDFQNYYLEQDSQQQVSPRLGIGYQWNESTQFKLSLGRFHQQESIQELQVIDGLTEFFKPQYADQVVAGIHWQAGHLKLVAELYRKRYGRAKGRFENIFNPFVLLPEMEPDRVGLWPEEVVAQGLDLDAGFTIAEPLDGYFRLSYMDARDRINGKWVDRRWSQTFTINTGLQWRRASYSLGAAVTWHSGWRSSRMPASVSEDVVLPIESVLNNARLDDYFSLDITARKHWQFPRWRVEVYADLVNVTDRGNQAGIDYDIEEVDGGYLLTPDQEALLGRVPSVGITVSF